MLELRKAINTILKDRYDKVYYHQASSQKTYPYIVFNFPNSYDNETQEVFNMDIDVWDYNDSTINVEQISSDIWRLFHRYHFINDDIQFSVYRMNRLVLEDDDPTHKRRKLIFELRYFDRRNN